MKIDHAPHVSRASGFSLIELMVVVGISAVLATIAISGYQSSVRKSRRTEARTALLDFASREERFMSTNSSYVDTTIDLGYGTGGFPVIVGSGYYQINQPTLSTATALTPATFSIQAVPVPGKGQDKDDACQKFTVNQTGLQQAFNSGGADSTVTCWN